MGKVIIENISNNNFEPEIEIYYKGENVLDFWKYDEKGNLKILQSKLMKFLGRNGFVNIKQNGTNIGLVQELNNRIRKSSSEEVTQIIIDHIENKNLDEVNEIFSKGIGSYLSKMKFNLLKSIDLIDDRDGKDNSRFYFLNCFVDITKDFINPKRYRELDGIIWENRVLNNKFIVPVKGVRGQFEQFCLNISKKDEVRFNALKSMLGYLLHRNKENGEDKAIILYDENMGIGNKAHGGTGKTLLTEAISQCREVVLNSGKHIKTFSFFVYQRVNLTTDVLVFDDLDKKISLEQFFDMITGGIEVEKKRKQAFYISREMMPKIMFTSNYLVKGPGGSSDIRRRYEFELANYYNQDFIPEDEFGNRFFDNNWSTKEWNKFYLFMMECVQYYLKFGLIKADPLNLDKNKILDKMNQEFIDFSKDYIDINKWIDKREFEEFFKKFNPEYKDTSPHTILKWLKFYTDELGGELRTKSTGSKYFFRIDKKVNDEE
jgi:hypothetical protein